MDFLNNVLSWLGSGLTGSILGIAGIVLAILASLFQHRVTYYSRQKYKKAVLSKIELVETYKELKAINEHNSLLIARVHASLIASIYTCTIALMSFVFSTSNFLEPRPRGFLSICFGLAVLGFTFRAFSAVRSVHDHISAITLSPLIVGRIIDEMKSGKASILTNQDKREIHDRLVAVAKDMEGVTITTKSKNPPPAKEEENGSSTPSKGNVTT